MLTFHQQEMLSPILQKVGQFHKIFVSHQMFHDSVTVNSSLQWCVCVCVRACVRACVCVHACVCA